MGSDNKSHRDLKRLEFVTITAVTVLSWISNLYENAKKRSPGPLKSTAEVVERVANVVIAPVHKKFKGMSDHLLAFFDEKVDRVVKRFDKYAPAFVKQFVNKARCMAQNPLKVGQTVVQKTRVEGPYAAIFYLDTLFTTSIMLLLVRFWSYKLSFAGYISGVGAVSDIDVVKKRLSNVASAIRYVAVGKRPVENGIRVFPVLSLMLGLLLGLVLYEQQMLLVLREVLLDNSRKVLAMLLKYSNL